MLIVRSPLRVTLGGGGTDLHSYYSEHEGFLMAAAINKYIYVTINRPFIEGIFLKYSEIENSKDIADIKHKIIREVLALENLNQLGVQFDYINASDILYLLPDIPFALKQLGTVLKPQGIIRSNLHSYYQRFNYYRAQTLFKQMGLMEGNPDQIELGIVRDFFSALDDKADLKLKTWGQQKPEDVRDETILMNYLFHW
jgi:SAM-dependent methyltransferase